MILSHIHPKTIHPNNMCTKANSLNIANIHANMHEIISDSISISRTSENKALQIVFGSISNTAHKIILPIPLHHPPPHPFAYSGTNNRYDRLIHVAEWHIHMTYKTKNYTIQFHYVFRLSLFVYSAQQFTFAPKTNTKCLFAQNGARLIAVT